MIADDTAGAPALMKKKGKAKVVPADSAAAAVEKKSKPVLAAVPSDPAVTASPPASAVAGAKPRVRKVEAAASDLSALTGAGCRTRSFLVNDYGQAGPTADARRLLDKDIADWSHANGLKNVTVSGKNVACRQSLNFIVFDEWTCTASAKVCWNASP